MSEQNVVAASNGEDPGMAAYHRYLRDQGMRAEQLREFIANARERELFVYSIQVRYPSKEYPSFSAVVKALTPEGPVIAFHNGYQLLEALLGIGQRIRAGNLEWRNDDYPPDDWAERLAYMHAQELNRE